MAATSDSNDASDIFWPGYVDAIANLTINLLFIIAVMSIVVLGITLQLMDTTKIKPSAETLAESKTTQSTKDVAKAVSQGSTAEVSAPSPHKAAQDHVKSLQDKLVAAEKSVTPSSSQASSQGSTAQDKAADSSGPANAGERPESQSKDLQEKLASAQKVTAEELAKATAQNKALQEQVAALQAKLAATQSSAESGVPAQGRPATATQRSQSRSKQEAASAEQATKPGQEEVVTEDSGRVEVVKAEQVQAAPKATTSQVLAQASGVVVAFSPDVVTLSESEIKELVGKLKALSSTLPAARWRISVVSPKGFSEALRLAFYRANAVRNVLLQNGVAGPAIDVRVSESVGAGASNAHVSVRTVP